MSADKPTFAACFKALLGYAPYRWQQRLSDELMAGHRIDALDLPTGLGKTAIMAIWLLARASGGPVPRRLVYVVDRRAVVDQASDVARRLAERLGPEPEEPNAAIRDTLSAIRSSLGLKGHDELPVSTLRGQLLDNQLWFRNPAAPAIIVGTVDMIGSRLLFEGYGVSRRMRPAHAGLLGLDTLLALDEAHLVPPFEALVRAVERMAGGDAKGLPIEPVRVMSLSATQRAGGNAFQLTDGDREEAAVRDRLCATKRLWLFDDVKVGEAAEALAAQAWTFAGGKRAVLVFCNSRAMAQAVQAALEALRKAEKAFKGAPVTALLVGERRFRERESLTAEKKSGETRTEEAEVFDRFRPSRDRAEAATPAFLIATSAGEVGIDLDADDMVCDLVAWERMVQRLGRVNRRAVDPEGLRHEARIAVIPFSTDKKDKETEDEVLDDALATLKAPFVSPLWPEAPACTETSPPGPDRRALDASPQALGDLRQVEGLKDLLDRATSSEPLRPPLTRASLESWTLTSLKEHPGRPKVDPFLRGWVDADPQTTLVWRRIFPLRRGESASTSVLERFFAAAPPHQSESLQAPAWKVAAVLRKRASAYVKRAKPGDEGGDEPDGAEILTAETTAPTHDPVVVILGPDGSVAAVHSAGALAGMKDDRELMRRLPAGTAVIDARLGGLDMSGLLDEAYPKKPSDPVPLTREDESWPYDRADDRDGSSIRGGARIGLGSVEKRRAALEKRPFWRPDAFRWAADDGDDPILVWVELWRGPRGTLARPEIRRELQTLRDHHARAAREARRIAEALLIPSARVEMLVAVAACHDLGKDRDLWQRAMNAPDDKGRPYAKTKGGGDFRLLGGYRHEFGTLRELLADPGRYLPAAVVDDPELLDLALHLIVAHHGHARPIIRPRNPDELPSDLEETARDAALRFARLQKRHGPWGLAWWETLLRAADWAASEELEGEAAIAPTGEALDG